MSAVSAGARRASKIAMAWLRAAAFAIARAAASRSGRKVKFKAGERRAPREKCLSPPPPPLVPLLSFRSLSSSQSNADRTEGRKSTYATLSLPPSCSHPLEIYCCRPVGPVTLTQPAPGEPPVALAIRRPFLDLCIRSIIVTKESVSKIIGFDIFISS